MTQPVRNLEENNTDGFWDTLRRRGFPDRRLALLRLEPEPTRTQRFRLHMRERAMAYVGGVVVLAAASALALVIHDRNSETTDISDYRPERAHERVLTSAEALRHMGLCELELKAEAKYLRFIRGDGSAAAAVATALNSPSPQALETAAALARDNDIPCEPRPGVNGAAPGSWRLDVPGGTTTKYPHEYTTFVGGPAEAACAKEAELEQKRANNPNPIAWPALDEAVHLQKLVSSSGGIICAHQ